MNSKRAQVIEGPKPTTDISSGSAGTYLAGRLAGWVGAAGWVCLVPSRIIRWSPVSQCKLLGAYEILPDRAFGQTVSSSFKLSPNPPTQYPTRRDAPGREQ